MEAGHANHLRAEIQDESENLALIDVPIIHGPSQLIFENWVEFDPSSELNPIVDSSLVQVISHESRLQEVQVEIDEARAQMESNIAHQRHNHLINFQLGSNAPQVSKDGAKTHIEADRALRKRKGKKGSRTKVIREKEKRLVTNRSFKGREAQGEFGESLTQNSTSPQGALIEADVTGEVGEKLGGGGFNTPLNLVMERIKELEGESK
ncbi:hypothetical protein V6N13_046331 [Hibiscus sabdariffa]